MSDLNGIDRVAGKNLGRVTSKTQVSIEAPQKNAAASSTESTQELKKLEFEMEQADHAFALMMEIREKIEKAYNELAPEGE